MDTALLARRFGRGVARLPIGRPEGGPSLSELARQPIPHERPLQLAPAVGFAAAIGILVLASSLPTTKPPALAERPPLEVQLWSDSLPLQTAEPARPTPSAVASIRRAAPRAQPTPRPRVEEQMPSPAAATSGKIFEAAWSASPAAGVPTEVFDPFRPVGAEAGSRSRSPSPSLADSSDRPPIGLPAATAPVPMELATSSAAAPLPAGTGPLRPARADTGRLPHLEHAGSTSDAGRRAFLASLESDAREASPASRAEPPRPAVSLAARRVAPADLDWAGLHAAGWREVPLDELPDCSPPGRQDLLKKRILLAAPFERECSHRDGSYRFVETRNLGAFLMWSRPNPDRTATPPRDRDACDVLERALRCLGDSSIEESTQR